MMAASRNMYDRLYVYMEHIKLINAQQAKSVDWYNDTKEELLQSNAAIWLKNCVPMSTCRFVPQTQSHVESITSI